LAKAGFADQVEEWIEYANKPRQDFIDAAEHAHYLFTNLLERWVPGSQEQLETDGHPASVENVIQSLVLDAVSLLLKNYPMFRVKPTKPSDFDLVDEINKHVLSMWKDSGAQRHLQLSQLGALISGMSVLEVYPEWNAFDEMEIKINLVPQTDIWFNPRKIDADDAWVIRRTWHDLHSLELKWGAATIERALSGETMMVDRALFPEFWSAQDDMYPLYTIWVPASEYLPNNSKWFSKSSREEAPFGRMIKMLGRYELQDIANPYAMVNLSYGGKFLGHRSHPYVVHECNRVVDPFGYSGFYDVQGLVNPLESTQWELNELSRVLMQMSRRVAQPPMIVPEGSLIDPTGHISYTAGKVIQYDPNVTPQPPTPVPLPNDTQMATYLHGWRMQMMREQSGIREMMTGAGGSPGTSHTPVGTITTAQEASFTRMWTIVSALDRCIEGIGKRFLGLMQEFVTPGKFNYLSESGEQWYGEWQDSHIEMEFRLEVVSGMSTPLRDMDRVQTASNLYQSIAPIVQMGPIPQNIPSLQLAKAFLTTINEPAAFEYLNLVNNMLQMAQGGMQQQQQQQPMAEEMPVEEQIVDEV
tara:strand:- start:9741 stop:11492 length:1752 start_codon:yes stop_codon:yes gene_type:complete